jgi:hypothetical protein
MLKCFSYAESIGSTVSQGKNTGFEECYLFQPEHLFAEDGYDDSLYFKSG